MPIFYNIALIFRSLHLLSNAGSLFLQKKKNQETLHRYVQIPKSRDRRPLHWFNLRFFSNNQIIVHNISTDRYQKLKICFQRIKYPIKDFLGKSRFISNGMDRILKMFFGFVNFLIVVLYPPTQFFKLQRVSINVVQFKKFKIEEYFENQLRI